MLGTKKVNLLLLTCHHVVFQPWGICPDSWKELENGWSTRSTMHDGGLLSCYRDEGLLSVTKECLSNIL
jgi:hypothetical protein